MVKRTVPGIPKKGRGQTDFYVAQLQQLLPARSYKEIQEKFAKRGFSRTIAQIGGLLTRLRSHSDIYGWTVPHVKRGNTNPDGCYFALYAEKDHFFIADVKKKKLALSGLHGDAQYAESLFKNAIEATRIFAEYLKPVAREELNDIVDDFAIGVRRMRAVLRRQANDQQKAG